MALTSISAESGATFEGRLLARNGEVTLINNTNTSPGCEQAVDDDADGTDTDADTDGADTDSDGSDADGADSDTGGTDTDTDGSDADTAAGDADSGTDADATGGGSADSDTTGGGTTASPDLPDTGGQSLWAVVLGAASLVAGAVLVSRRRYRPTHVR